MDKFKFIRIAVIESEITDDSVEKNAEIKDFSLTIEDVFKTFIFVDAKGMLKTIPLRDLQIIYLNEDKLSIVLSYINCEVHFKLTQDWYDWQENVYHCVPLFVKTKSPLV